MSAELTIPDFVPVLRRGAGSTPRDGGCLVQIASWLHGGLWTDMGDDCGVHRVLRPSAVSANDQVDDLNRRALAPAAARISGTVEATRGWDAGALDALFVLMGEHGNRTRPALDLEVFEDPLGVKGEPGKAIVDWFYGQIDAFDALTGRAAPAEVPEATWRELREVMAGRAPAPHRPRPGGLSKVLVDPGTLSFSSFWSIASDHTLSFPASALAPTDAGGPVAPGGWKGSYAVGPLTIPTAKDATWSDGSISFTTQGTHLVPA